MVPGLAECSAAGFFGSYDLEATESQRTAGGKPKRSKTALPNQSEGSGGKEVTGDTDDEIEEIEGNGDPAITTTDGNNELEEAEVEVRRRQEGLQQA
eukprot:jgi/Tetstr1/462561/TSEL_007549.t1